jgi:hypothetical protein
MLQKTKENEDEQEGYAAERGYSSGSISYEGVHLRECRKVLKVLERGSFCSGSVLSNVAFASRGTVTSLPLSSTSTLASAEVLGFLVRSVSAETSCKMPLNSL